MAAQTAISTRTFVDTLGVNTHIDFANYGYQNLADGRSGRSTISG